MDNKIHIHILRNKEGNIYSFKVLNHAESFVCAAVSILALNTVNSIESFTDEEFVCDFDENGGYLMFEALEIKNGKHNGDAQLLLKSFYLGISSIEKEYKEDISIIEEVL